MIKLSHISFLSHAALWGSAYFLLSPYPLGLVELKMGSLSPRGVSLFLLYEFFIKILFVYTYAHIALPTFLKQRRPLYFIGINLAYVLVFAVTDWAISRWVLYPEVTPDSWAYTMRLGMMQLVVHIFLLVFANLYGFAYAWYKERNLRRILDKEKLRAELNALRHQIHPHFLFNSLNSLAGLAYTQQADRTAEGITQLSHMMRYMIYETSAETVPLEKEIAYIQNYLDLQKLRIGDSVEVAFTIEGTITNRQIAPLLFIPFIENAFKYGISKLSPSYVRIQLRSDLGQITFSVENTLHDQEVNDHSYGGVGLINVKQRLQLLYPHAHQLTVTQTQTTYTVTLLLDI